MKLVIFLLLIIIIMFTYLIYKTRKLEKFYNDLVSSEKISIGEEFGFGMFEGDNEMHIYNFTPTAIQGPAGVAAGGTLSIPKIGFNIDQVRANGLENTITTTDNIEHVDNSLMVPYLFILIKRLVANVSNLQDQLIQLADSN